MLPFVTDRVRGPRTAEDQHYYEKVFTPAHKPMAEQRRHKGAGLPGRPRPVRGPACQVPGLRIWTDQALVKEPYGNPTGYHLDVPFWSFSSPDAITIWLALDDATLENGCLYYVPGSHKAAKI